MEYLRAPQIHFCHCLDDLAGYEVERLYVAPVEPRAPPVTREAVMR